VILIKPATLLRFHRALIQRKYRLLFTLRGRPFIERLIGTIRREYLDHVLFWNRLDLQRKIGQFAHYYNHVRVHSALSGTIAATVLHHKSPICCGSPGKLTVTVCSTHQSPLDQQFAIDRSFQSPECMMLVRSIPLTARSWAASIRVEWAASGCTPGTSAGLTQRASSISSIARRT
jgi:Integrase core domain